eukprot:Sdes_comp9857_c0_seq1m1401
MAPFFIKPFLLYLFFSFQMEVLASGDAAPTLRETSHMFEHISKNTSRKTPLFSPLNHKSLHPDKVPWCPNGPPNEKRPLLAPGHLCKTTLGAPNLRPGIFILNSFLPDFPHPLNAYQLILFSSTLEQDKLLSD